MGFFDFLGVFVKRIVFFVGGFIVAFPITGVVITTGSSVQNHLITPNPIMAIVGIILFIIGIAMMVYSAKLTK